MIIRNISVRSKLIMTTLVLVMLLIILALIYMDTSRRVESHAELLKERSGLNSNYLSLQNSFQALKTEESPVEKANLLRQLHQV